MAEKMEDNKIALRYARALFETAVEKDDVDAVRDSLNEVGDVYQSVPDMTRFLQNPGIPVEDKQSFLQKQFGGKKTQPLVGTLLNLLLENGRVSVLPYLVRQYNDLADTHENVAKAEVVTAAPLDAKLEKKLQKALETNYGYSRVELETNVDPKLLGGVIVRLKDQVLDGSFIGRLEALRKQVS